MITAVTHVTRSLIAHAAFACAMAARELKSSSKGALLGLAWLVLRPLLVVAAYVGIIRYIFGMRFGQGSGTADYVLYVLSGMVAWQAVQQVLEQAPSLMRERRDILQQVMYPIETLPLTTMLVGCVAPGVGLAAYLVLALTAGQLSWTVLFLPVPVALLVVFLCGCGWMFMIAGVLLKDLREVLTVFFSLAVYVSPVLLSKEMIGPRLWNVILLNPLAHVVICFRDVLQGGLHPVSWAIFAGTAAVTFVSGAWCIFRTKVLINEYL